MRPLALALLSNNDKIILASVIVLKIDLIHTLISVNIYNQTESVLQLKR